jgi:hypothetical protein
MKAFGVEKEEPIERKEISDQSASETEAAVPQHDKKEKKKKFKFDPIKSNDQPKH